MVEKSDSLFEKLEEFASGLADEEREILGELLAHAVHPERSVDDVRGAALGVGESPSLTRAIKSARKEGHLSTRLHLSPSPQGVVLAAAGPVAGGFTKTRRT